MSDPTNTDSTPSNFIRAIVEKNISQGLYGQKKWGGSPGDAKHHEQGSVDAAKIRTRFPPNRMAICILVMLKAFFLILV